MAKSSGLVTVGWLFSLFGAILMIVSGAIIILNNVVSEFESLTGVSLGFIPLDSTNQIFYGFVVIILGIIVLWIWKNKKMQHGDLLLYGVLFIIIGIITSFALAGLLVFIGGGLFLIEYFF
ncbi:MAG: hypothetical protein ACW967_06245 [Candidatus Hodarchaeales archaeon]